MILKEIITINLRIMKHIDTVTQEDIPFLSYYIWLFAIIFKPVELQYWERERNAAHV